MVARPLTSLSISPTLVLSAAPLALVLPQQSQVCDPSLINTASMLYKHPHFVCCCVVVVVDVAVVVVVAAIAVVGC